MPERYSRVRGGNARSEDEDKWFIGYDYLVFFMVVGLGAVLTMVMAYGMDSPLVQFATFQMIFAFLGLVLFLFANVFPQWNIRAGWPTREDVERMFRWFLILFPILLVMTTLLGLTLQSTIVGPDLQVAMTSSIVEEALFGAGIGTLVLNIIWYMFSRVFGPSKTMKILSELIAAVIVASFFAITHVGAYGFVFRYMATLFANRFIYQIAYYRTRNIMLPTLMHMMNNFIVFAL